MNTHIHRGDGGPIELLIKNRRLVFSLLTLLMVLGILAASGMARQEDPSFPYRAGLVRIIYPGATPLQIEQLITAPLEEELAQLEEISKYRSVSRDDIGIVTIELKDQVYDTNAAWERVRRAIERAENEFPDGVAEIDFDDRQIDIPVAVISVTGTNDTIMLDNAAIRLKQLLLNLPGISRIEIEGDPQTELLVKLNQQAIDRLGVSREFIARTLAQRNQIVPGGLVATKVKNVRLNTQSDYQSVAALRATNIQLPGGQIVPLSAIAEVALEPKLPLASQAYKDGRRAVSLGIIAQRGQTDMVTFGENLRARLSEVSDQFAPLKLEESFFQPDYVQQRLDSLQGSLAISVIIIALVVFIALGWRTGILVSLVLPSVSLISLGLYNVGGGVFHQIAVIGIVISLGILIDNAIVVVEYIENALATGREKGEAIRGAIRVLAKPLMASTGTTVAAFIPLLLAKGGVGDFTRAIPTMITIALLVSYVVSVFVLPLLAYYWLKPRQSSTSYQAGGPILRWTSSVADYAIHKVVNRPRAVLLVTVGMVTVSLLLAPMLKQSFFPPTDRAQIVLDVELPANTPLARTRDISADIERRLQAQPGVAALYRSVGASGFQFYYNLSGAPDESNLARLTIDTRSQSDNLLLIDWIRSELKPDYPDAVLIPRLLGQGPPRPAPIEIRVQHPDFDSLFEASQTLLRVLAATRGITELRSNLDLGTPEVVLDVQDHSALSLGLQPAQIATAVFSQSRGLNAGQYRYGDDPIPIRVRSGQGQATEVGMIGNQLVYGADQAGVPVGQLAALETHWTPTSVRRFNGQRTVTVLAQIKQGAAFNQILADFKDALATEDLPAGVSIEYGGDAAASAEANSSIAGGAPLAAGLLLIFMMLQFNSFRRIGIVLATIPLAAVGVIPGLVISDQPFGFQSLLGVIALVGIVVNNAIVLIDVIDQKLAEGEGIDSAVAMALKQRTTPIILTTATTILGLLPLALSSSTLWPPMAWAIISGLLLSTILTLFAIPALSHYVLGRHTQETPAIELPRRKAGSVSAAVAVLVGVGLLFTGDIQPAAATEFSASQITVEQIVAEIEGNRDLAAARFGADAAEAGYQQVRREAWAPTLSLEGQYEWRDDASTIELPTGSLAVSDDSAWVYDVTLTQPLFDPAIQRHKKSALRFERDANSANAEYVLHRLTGEALRNYLALLSLHENQRAEQSLEASLRARRDRIEVELATGRALKTDRLQIEVELNRIRQRLVVLENRLRTESQALSRLLNRPTQTVLRAVPPGDVHAALPAVKVGVLGSDFGTDTIVPEQCLQRLDCQVLLDRFAALSSRSAQVDYGKLPSVSLSLAERRSDGQLFVSERDQRAILNFRWALFTGGQRKQKRLEIDAQAAALGQQLISLQQSIQLDMLRAEAAWQNAESALQLAEVSLELGVERRRLSRKRYDGGLLNLDELLNAEAGVAAADAALANAKIGLVDAWVRFQLANGANYDALIDAVTSQSGGV